MVHDQQAFSFRALLLNLIQFIELPILAALIALTILGQRIDQQYLTLGLVALLLPSVLRLLVTARVVAPTLTLVPLLFLLALCALTIYVTPSWEYTWPELTRLFTGMALCVAVINWMNPIPIGSMRRAPAIHGLPWRFTMGTIAFLLITLALTMVGLMALGPTTKFGISVPWSTLPPIQGLAASGSFNPNRVAGVAAPAVPLVFALLIGTLRPRRSTVGGWLGWFFTKGFSLLALLFLSGALLLTQSRGALLAVGCATVIILPFLGRRGLVLFSGLIVLMVTALFQLDSTHLQQFLVLDTSGNLHNGNLHNGGLISLLLQDRNINGRWILWQRAFHGIADAPLTGMGLGAFEEVSQQPYPQLVGYVPDPDMSHVHNIILQQGVDFGLPGIIVFVALLALMALLLVQLARNSPKNSPLRTWSVGLLGTYIAYFVYNMFDALTLGSRPSVIVWLLFGLWIGAGEWLQSQRHLVEKADRSNAVAELYRRRSDRTAAAVNAVAAEASDGTIHHEDDDQADEVVDEIVDDGARDSNDPASNDSWESRAWAITAGNRE